ncbi:hypothetical protein GCM10023185_22060 [Hymenobacter saemangeumensis]|uniref:GYF domain-containing protein n=1 Tax=Hymenobacter saemangeumensis TaxID=1084522 RepID=A0ABP8IF39_9BACT
MISAIPGQWHYEVNGKTNGPVDQTGLQELLNTQHIKGNTLVWRPGFDQWIELQQSELQDVLTIPPPLSGNRVDNTIVWILAFAPVLGMVLESILGSLMVPREPAFPGGPIPAQPSLAWVYLALNTALSIWDERRLKAAGYSTRPFGGIWLFLVPVYLFKRAKSLQQKPSYAWTWVAVLLASIFIV